MISVLCPPFKFENPENLPLQWIRMQHGARMFGKFFVPLEPAFAEETSLG